MSSLDNSIIEQISLKILVSGMHLKSSRSSRRTSMLNTAFLIKGCKDAFRERLPCNVCIPLTLLKGIIAILEKTLMWKEKIISIILENYVTSWLAVAPFSIKMLSWSTFFQLNCLVEAQKNPDHSSHACSCIMFHRESILG